MVTERNRQVRLARQLRGVPTEDCFEVVESDRAEPGPGQLLLEVIDLSLDPYLRSAIAGRHLGAAEVKTGALVPGRALARVVRSRKAHVSSGEYVVAETGWQEWAVVAASAVEPIAFDATVAPPSAALGALGMPGLAAYAGLTEMLRPRPGDVFAVSAPLGPVGSTAAQLARVEGCRTVGITSSAEKCRVAIEQLGFDACVDRTAPNWVERLRDCCPDGIDLYFDNAGGDVLDGVVEQLRPGGRVVLCGLMDQYNDGPVTRIRAGALMSARATVMGLIVYDYLRLQPEMLRRLSALIRTGELRLLEDRVAGLDRAPAAFCRLMRGENVGKALVRVGDPD